MIAFYKNCKMQALRMTVSLFARPLNVKNLRFLGFRGEMDKTRATSAVKCKPAKRIKYVLPGVHFSSKNDNNFIK